VRKDKRPYVIFEVEVRGTTGTPLAAETQLKSLARMALGRGLLGTDATVQILEHVGDCGEEFCGMPDAEAHRH
jgi:hypothetical protein